MSGLGFLPGGSYSSAYDMTPDGSVVVGWSFRMGSGAAGAEAFLWTEGVMTGLGELPGGAYSSLALGVSADANVVVGFSVSTKGAEAFRWTAGVMTGLGDLPGGTFQSEAWAVSADGSILVGSGQSDSGQEAFLWVDGLMSGLGDLPGGGFLSAARDVSADGSVVVGSGESDVGAEAFIWTAESGMLNLRDLLVNTYGLDLTDWTLREATSISEDGMTIVGYGTNPDGQTEAWIARIPEPSTLAVLSIGGLWSLRKRRYRRRFTPAAVFLAR